MKPTKFDMNKRNEVIRWFKEMKQYLKCGSEVNADCKNYGGSWDTKHHSMCPFCPPLAQQQEGGNGIHPQP